MSINEVCYSSLLLCEAESFCYSVFILRTCNLNSNYSLGYLECFIYRVWTPRQF